MAEPLAGSDREAFWRAGARARFLEYSRLRFGAMAAVSAPAVDAKDPSQMTWWDPAVLPAFVQESLGKKAGDRIQNPERGLGTRD
jgi:hypothetical protein